MSRRGCIDCGWIGDRDEYSAEFCPMCGARTVGPDDVDEAFAARCTDGYFIGFAWDATISGVHIIGSGCDAAAALTGDVAERLLAAGCPARAFDVGGEDPATPMIRWLVGCGCGVQRANDVIAHIGKHIHGPDCNW